MGKEQDLFKAAQDGDVATIERLLHKKENGAFSRCRAIGIPGAARGVVFLVSRPSLTHLRRVAVVWRSLRRGASPNATDESGFTPLHFACLHGHYDSCVALLKAAANANARDNKGNTPLHLAAWGGHARVAQLLLTGKTATSRGSVNAQALNGETALHAAARNGHHDALGTLLKCAMSRPCLW